MNTNTPRPMPAPYLLQVGTRIRVTLTDGKAYDMTISQRYAPGDMGRSYASGPHIVAHIRPGGYSVALDSSEVASVELLPEPAPSCDTTVQHPRCSYTCPMPMMIPVEPEPSIN